MCLRSSFIALLILQQFASCSVHLINFTDLMKTYYLLCGPEYFCLPHSRTHQWEISPTLSYLHMGVCPECHCDSACIKRGDCCADLYFSFPDLSCVNRTIINGRNDKYHSDQASALMVTSCPIETNNELKQKCTSFNDTKSRLRNFPVTGSKIPLTFYNKYCAECHGVENYTVWTLDIDCSVFADFNFLSNLEEVIDMAFDRECIFQAFQEDDRFGEFKQENCFDIDEEKTLYTKCNQTGEWIDYDPNVAYACESFYKRKYRIFKNVFCYMCNPSGQNLLAEKSFSTCNITGQWSTYDSGLQRACLKLPKTLSTLPFKNIFCYLCNRGNDSSQIFVDVIGEFKEFPIYNDYFHYQYDLYINDYNLEFLIHASQRKMEEDETLGNIIYSPYKSASFKTNEGTIVNITNLLLQKAAMSDLQVCDSRGFLYPNGYTSHCTCEISCLFEHENQNPNCCDDLWIQVPMHCRNLLVHHPFNVDMKKGVPTLNGCFQESTSNLIKKGCTLPESGDIFSLIPISDLHGVNYDNFYCVLCNLNSDELIMKMQGKMVDLDINETSIERDYFIYVDEYLKSKRRFASWDLEIVCSRYLDYIHFLNAGELITIAEQMDCRIRFKTWEDEEFTECLLPGQPKIRCADKTNWAYSDEDTKWACNNLINYELYLADLLPELPTNFDSSEDKHYRSTPGYTNIFCALCKPNRIFPEYFIDNCTVNYRSDLCFHYPRIYYYYPFKNLHCLFCNNFGPSGALGGDPGSDLDIYNPAFGIAWFPLLRNMFSISGDDVIDDEPTRQCENNQVYDEYQELCRNITCYSGKYLVNKKCIPLLDMTINLQYSMTLFTGLYEIKERIPNNTYSSLKVALIHNINNYFSAKMSVRSAVKIEMIADFGGSGGNNHNDCMFIELKIFFQSSVPRLQIEQSLIRLKHRFEDNCRRNITRSNDKDHGIMEKMGRLKKRFIAEPFFFGYYSAKVASTLLCPQIELDDDEYNVSDDFSVLTLSRDGFDNEILSDEFAMTPDGRMRVCLEYLQKINYIPAYMSDESIALDLKKKYLWILSLGSSGLSIICLLVGLICYAILPSLRTIPGKLIMMLMTSLLLTLIFLQLSYFVVQMEYGCIAIAIVLHFTWLSVFMSTQAANHHMWRTFTSMEVSSHTSDKILLKYLAYIFGVPTSLICVSVVCGLTLHSRPFGVYGGSNCFIRHTNMLIGLFICPVALICLTNIVFFSLTARAIKRTPTAECNQRKRNELVIFTRLTTVTGVSWLLQIIDSFLPFTYFTFISTIINSLQGLFIFIAFIVNKRVWGLLRKKLGTTYYTESTQTQSENLRSASKTTESRS